MLTILYASLFYLATATLIGGLAWRIYDYARTPAPLKIPVMPAPLTKKGVAFRLTKEVVFFASLFKSNKWIWLFGWVFHVAMALVVLRHLRYVTDPVWTVISIIQPIGMYAGFAMLGGLLALWARRFLLERMRYISSPSDHLMLAMLVAITVSGFLMQYVERVDIIAVKAFMLGLMQFTLQPLPEDPILLIHLGLVATLMIIFPFSKLLHAPGVFFAPSRNQVDDAREKRHVGPWTKDLDAKRGR